MTAWSDEPEEESLDQEEEEISWNFVAFTVRITKLEYELDESMDQDDESKMSYLDLEDAYVQLFKKWEVLLKAHGTALAHNDVHEKIFSSYENN